MRALLYGFWSVAFKEILHIRRDPTTLVIALMIPVLQLTIFGYAIDFDIRHIRTVIVDMDHSRESRSYVDSLKNTQYIDVINSLPSPEDAEIALRKGSASIAVIIPPDFARKSVTDGAPQVRVLIDGSDNQVASRARVAFLSAPAATRSGGGVEARVNMVFNPQMRTQVFMIPGLIAVILQLVTVSLTSFSIVREREQGTLEQLMVSPVGILGLMLGKLIPYAGLAFFEMVSVLFLGRVIFDVHSAGSLALLLLLSAPFIVAALGMGLLISTIAQNQAQALQMTMLITLPSILMSGFVFPRDTMPGVLYLATFILPVTYFLEILRGIIVRGAGFADIWVNVSALMLISAALLILATRRFRKSVG